MKCGKSQQIKEINEVSRALLNKDPEYHWNFKHFLVQRMFILKPSTKQKVEARWQEIGFVNTGDHIGVHIRGTDKTVEARQTKIKDYVQAIVRAAGSNASPRIYIAAD